MNNVNTVPVDIEEMRLWVKGYMEEQMPPMNRTKFATAASVPLGTFGPWLDGKYAGDNDGVARKIMRFKQQVEAAQAHDEALPVNPGYFETETSKRIEKLLSIAHTGRITAAGMGPGTGKTITVQEYEESVSQVYVATMRPSTKRLGQMIREILNSLGPKMGARSMLPADASREVINFLRGKRALLVIDEANNLSIDSVEEIRSWNDKIGVGICFLGNEDFINEIESGKSKTQLARVNGRFAWKHIQDVPTEEDVRIFCEHWLIKDHAIRTYLRDIATTRGSGGLRECRQLVEMATLMAREDQRGLLLDDLRDVQAQRASRWVKA